MPESTEPTRQAPLPSLESGGSTADTSATAPSAPAPDSLPLPTVAGYEILAELGRGGMGVVYQARQLALNRVVALKMVVAGDHARPENLVRFLAEAEAAAALQHPHVAHVYDVGKCNGRPYFSMEYCSGGTLAERLRVSPLAPADAAALVAKLADAMQTAHDRGILHRDLKPANVLFQVADLRLQVDRSAEGTSGQSTINNLQFAIPKITDFGLAKRFQPGSDHDESGLTHTGLIIGTPSYMAPEQAAGGAKRVGPAADVYSLGAILYECLTGRPPFRGANQLETLALVLDTEPPAVRSLQPAAPRDLETIALKCLAKDPAKRYAAATELAADLNRFLNGESIVARPVGRVERGVRWARRKPTAAALVAVSTAAVLLIVAGSIGFAARLRTERNDAEGARLRAEELLVRFYGERGMQRIEAGDLSTALPWLAESLRLDEVLGHRTNLQRTRLAAVMDQCARPRHVWTLDDPVAQTAVGSDGRWIAAGTVNGIARLWDPASGDRAGPDLNHGAGLFRLASDRGGQHLLTAGGTAARVWEFDHGAWRAKLTAEGDAVLEAQISPDGQRLVACFGAGIEIWDVERGTVRRLSLLGGPQARARSAAISHDGRTVLVVTDTGQFQLFDAATGTITPVNGLDQVRAAELAFLPGGDFWLAPVNDNDIVLGDSTGHWHRIGQHPDGATRIVPNADGSKFATVGGNRVVVWQLVNVPMAPPPPGAAPDQPRPETPEVLRRTAIALTTIVHRNSVTGAEFSHDGRWILTASADQTARVWDAERGFPLTPPLRHGCGVQSAGFTADGRGVMVACEDQSVRVWDLPRSPAVVAVHPHEVNHVSWSPDGRTIATACDDGYARLWDVTTGRVWPAAFHEGRLRQPGRFRHRGTVYKSQISADGTHLLTSGDDGSAVVWPISLDVRSKSDWATIGLALFTGQAAGGIRLNHSGPVWARSAIKLARLSAGGCVATSGPDGRVKIWDARTGALIADIDHRPRPLTKVSPPSSESGLRAQFWPAILNLCLQQEAVPQPASSIPQPPQLGPAASGVSSGNLATLAGQPPRGYEVYRSAEFDASGRWLVTAGDDRNVRVWDAATGASIGQLPPQDNTVFHAAFGPGSNRIVVGGQIPARVWSFDPSGQSHPVSAPMVHQGPIYHVTFSPGGKMVATASADETARVWTEQGQPLTPPLVHSSYVYRAEFSRDEKYLLTVGADVARLWDIETGQMVLPPMAHGGGEVNWAEFRPDGGAVATAGRDHAARVWLIPPPDARPIDTLLDEVALLSGTRLENGQLVPVKAAELAAIINRRRPQ